MKNLKHTQSGFTLMELMIVVAISAIIAGIALPAYTQQIQKSKRSDAKISLLRIAQLQESYFVQNLSYAKSFKDEVGGLKASGTDTVIESEHDVYDVSITATPDGCKGVAGADACTGYELDATATNGQLLDKDCRAFQLNNIGRKRAKKYGGSFDIAQGKLCWK